MSIRAGQILHAANGTTVLDRLQTVGPSSLNIPEERIYEVGNFQTVAVIRDIPDLTWDAESFDVSTEFEAIITGGSLSPSAGTAFDLNDALPMDIISPWKATMTDYTIAMGVIVPYLTLENATYRFGLRQNATQSFTFRGDSIFYVPDSPYSEEFTLVNNTLTYNFANTATSYDDAGDTLYALSACVKNPTTGAYKRLFFGSDYTNTSSSITLLQDWFDSGYTKLHITYGSATAASYGQGVHATTSVKPAAVRGKDIDLYVSDGAATPTLGRWRGVQSFEINRRVTLEADEEFGNNRYVTQDYDIPEVSGNIVVRSVDVADFYAKVAQVAGLTTSDIIGPNTSVTLELELGVDDPDTGDRLKTFYVSDARIQIPGPQARVQTKLDVTFPWSSDSGSLLIYEGERP